MDGCDYFTHAPGACALYRDNSVEAPRDDATSGATAEARAIRENAELRAANATTRYHSGNGTGFLRATYDLWVGAAPTRGVVAATPKLIGEFVWNDPSVIGAADGGVTHVFDPPKIELSTKDQKIRVNVTIDYAAYVAARALAGKQRLEIYHEIDSCDAAFTSQKWDAPSQLVVVDWAEERFACPTGEAVGPNGTCTKCPARWPRGKPRKVWSRIDPRRGRGSSATPSPRTIHRRGGDSSEYPRRGDSSEYPRRGRDSSEYPRRGGDSSPLNIHVAAATRLL